MYRLLEEHFERFKVIYEEQFERGYGPLRPVAGKAVMKYLECGILAALFTNTNVFSQRCIPTHRVVRRLNTLRVFALFTPCGSGASMASVRHRICEQDHLENGFARVVCGKCKAEFFVGYSCKVRMLCPSCHAKRLTIWSEWLGTDLLENLPHRMITLTVPKRIRPFFLWDRKLLGLLARCSAETIKYLYIVRAFRIEIHRGSR